MKSLSLNQPHGIIMVGIPGSGKTTFAEKFSNTFNAPFIDIDPIILRTRDETAADELLLLHLKELMRTKSSIIIEANAATRIRRTELAKLLKDNGYQPLLVWVQTDVETARQRSIRMKKMSSEDYAHNLKQFSKPHANEKATVVSGKHTYASQAKIVLKRLSAERTTQAAESPTPSRAARIAIQ
jgi:predicted kinase